MLGMIGENLFDGEVELINCEGLKAVPHCLGLLKHLFLIF